MANFGELRELVDMPGVLLESAFFDGTETPPGGRYPDNRSLHDPRFRYVLARAYVRGLIAAMAPGATLPPADGPTHLVARQIAPGIIRASWQPVPEARGYRVYLARGGRVFDGGTLVEDPWMDIPEDERRRPLVIRVTALNEGGESRASGAVAARPAPAGQRNRVLLVDAYDRQDAWVREDQNHRDYLVEHAMAIADLGPEWGFDGAQDEALLDGVVHLSHYDVSLWNLGRESVEHETFPAQAQDLVSAFLQGGGCLLATGSEIAWDLDLQGSASDKAFIRQWFGAALEDDDAGSRKVTGVVGEVFEDLGEVPLGTAGNPTYDPAFPDAFSLEGRSRAVLRYANGQIAAVSMEDMPGRSMLWGFPLETLRDPEARSFLVGRFLEWCRETWPAPAEEGPGEGEEWSGGDMSGEEPVREWTETSGDRPDVGGVVPRDLPWGVEAGPGRGEVFEEADEENAGGDGALPDVGARPGECLCGGCAMGSPGHHRWPVVLSGLLLLWAWCGLRRGQGGPRSRQRSSPPSS